MNQYGQLAMRHWQRHVPSRIETMADPVAFFTGLGEQIAADVAALTYSLTAQPNPPLDRLAAHFQAQEMVMRQLVWIKQPELSLAEAREEWEMDRPMDEGLANWAYRMQDLPEDEGPSMVEIEDMAERWAVPISFIDALLASPNPTRFLAENEMTMAEAASIRFLREIA